MTDTLKLARDAGFTPQRDEIAFRGMLQLFAELIREDYRAELLGVSVEPFGYLCEWLSKNGSYPNTQAFYEGEPGNAIDDDWNEHPEIYKNLPLYTAESLAARVVQAQAEEREACASVCDEKHYHWRWDNEPDSASGPRECAIAIRARGE
jgi:hypothetical protein